MLSIETSTGLPSCVLRDGDALDERRLFRMRIFLHAPEILRATKIGPHPEERRVNGASRRTHIIDRKSTSLNYSHKCASRMPSSARNKKQPTIIPIPYIHHYHHNHKH